MASCRTVAVDDHRYEIASMTTDTMSWYAIIVSLRVLGQSYAWLRFVALIVCCYMARMTESHLHTASVAKRIGLTIRTVLLIPSQVLVYGSIVLIPCYSIAHLIDVRFVNELVAEEFNTVQGIIDIKMASFFRINAVAMRSVWIVATLCHILLAIYVRRSWTPTHGVPGIPEFSIGVVVVATLFAHVRPRSARDTRLLEIEEVVPSAHRVAIQSLRHNSQSHELTSLIKGAMLDGKCICCGAILVLTVIILLRLLHRVLPNWQKYRMIFLSRTSVPYCGGFLWHANAVVVTWDGTFIARNLTDERRNSDSGVLFAPSFRKGSHVVPTRIPSVRDIPRLITVVPRYDSFGVDKRAHRVDTMIYLINLAIMSDPLILLRLRLSTGHHVGVYEDRSNRCIMLPFNLANDQGDVPVDWTSMHRIGVVDMGELGWWALLQCG